MILLSLSLIETIDRLDRKITRLSQAKELLSQDEQIPHSILANLDKLLTDYKRQRRELYDNGETQPEETITNGAI